MTRLDHLIRRLAAAGVVLILLLACVSAYLRLSAAGIGCVPWPACYERQVTREQHHPVARLAHRGLASTLGLVVTMIALVSIALRPRRLVLMGPAFTALALTVALAGVGSVTSTSGTTGVSLANLLGGIALAALLWWLVLRAGRSSAPASGGPGWLAAVVVGLVAIQLALGALLSTTHAAAQCSTMPLCPSSASDLPAALHICHRVIAITLLAAAAALTVTLTRRRAYAVRPALALTVLLLIQTAVGVLMVALDFPLWLALVHNAGALLVLLSAVWMLAVY